MESVQRDSVNGVKGIPLGRSRDASPGRGLLNTQGNPDRHFSYCVSANSNMECAHFVPRWKIGNCTARDETFKRWYPRNERSQMAEKWKD